jgi:CheY-like chemotaxis protein
LLERIFDPFFTTRPAGGGTGLGLSVSQAIVRRHRGTLVAENLPPAEGGGARFVVSFPFVERRRKKRRQDQEREPVRALPGGRVMVVEDEESIRVAVRRFLERRGWAVVEAGDGDVALRQLASARFDAVLCDLHIPGPSGMDVYDQGLALNPDLAGRFILLSGDASATPVQEFLARTGAQLLEKPFELRALVRAIEQAASRPA